MVKASARCPSVKYMTRPARLERATYGFEGRRSIQLSYGRIFSIPPEQTAGKLFITAINKLANGVWVSIADNLFSILDLQSSRIIH